MARCVWIWCRDDRVNFFGIGKWALGLYLSSGAAVPHMAPLAHSSRYCFGSIIRHKSSFLALNSPRSNADRTGRGVEPADYAVRIKRAEIELDRRNAEFV